MGKKHSSCEGVLINIVKSACALNTKYQAEFLPVNPSGRGGGSQLSPFFHPTARVLRSVSQGGQGAWDLRTAPLEQTQTLQDCVLESLRSLCSLLGSLHTRLGSSSVQPRLLYGALNGRLPGRAPPSCCRRPGAEAGVAPLRRQEGQPPRQSLWDPAGYRAHGAHRQGGPSGCRWSALADRSRVLL